MMVERTWCRWLGALVAAAAAAAAPAARADEADATWSALRGREIIVETRGGKLVAGQLIDVRPTTVALVHSGGDSIMIDRENVLRARDAGGERLPSGVSDVASTVREWREGDPVPIGYRKRTRIRTGLVIAGSVVFGAAWVPSAVVSGVASLPWLAIPVAGPAIGAGYDRTGYAVFYGLDAAQQAVGLALLIVGLAAPQTVIEPPGVGAPRRWWTPVPLSFGRGSVGVGIVGSL